MKENNFESKTFSLKKFDDLKGRDLSEKDLKNIPLDILTTTSFDTLTKWPNNEKLPVNFSPETILENGKNPGLGLQELHEQGVTGKGINVAIIDQKLDLRHDEYSKNLFEYKEFGRVEKENISMHGPGVASLFVGKNCGVAPEAKLHYKAVPSGNHSNWNYCVESLNEIMEYNSIVEDNNKIKIVSYSNGQPNPGFKGNLDIWIKTIEKAKSDGIIFIDANTFFDLNFTGGGSTEKENINKYNSWLAINDKIDMFDKINPTWKNMNRIIVPCDYRTIAASCFKENEYIYDARGGISWSIPYLSGLFALMLQVNNNLKMDEMVKIIHDTVLTNNDGLKVINPKGIINLAKNN